MQKKLENEPSRDQRARSGGEEAVVEGPFQKDVMACSCLLVFFALLLLPPSLSQVSKFFFFFLIFNTMFLLSLLI